MLRRQKGMRVIDRVLDGATQPPWYGQMPHIALKGLLTFDECIFWHTPSRTVIVADFLMNLRETSATPPYTRLMYKLSRMEGRLAVFPLLRWFGLANRASLQNAAAHLVGWKPDRIVVGHGAPLTSGVSEELLAALSWILPSARDGAQTERTRASR